MLSPIRRTTLAATCGSVLLASAATQTPLTSVRVAAPPGQTVVESLGVPGDTDRFFMVLQTGQILVVRGGQTLPQPFLDIAGRVLSGGEQGLLGLAFHPRYAQNGLFYVNYTRAGDGATMVERYSVSADPDVADPQSRTVMLGPVAQPGRNHNGGCLRFGPDGYLYVAMGDGGAAACRAQDGQSLLGKMLRLDVDSATSRIPSSNPFVGDPTVRDEVWALGLRNPWRFAFDRATGDLWIADVGWQTKEEVDFQPAASAGGENYGWPVMEGLDCRNTCASAPACNDPALTLPIHEYGHTGGNCSISGGVVYRGCAIPDLRGSYFFADFCSARIWSLRFDGSRVTQLVDRSAELAPSGVNFSLITSLSEDADGEILISTRSRGVFRIVPRGPPPGRDLGFGTTGSNGAVPQFRICGVLVPGAAAELRLSRARPSAPAAMLLGLQNNPTAIPPFGTVVPFPALIAAGLATDGEGVAALPVPAGLTPGIVYGQCAVLDPGGPGGIALSNALEITIP